ncbi:MAG: neutral zinc metallopeptidase [Actinomycetota bacterium]
MVKVRRGYRSKNVSVEGATGRSGGLRMPQSRGGKAGAGAGGAGLLGIIVVVVISLLSGGGGGGLGDALGGLDVGQENNGTGAPPPAITEDQLSEWSGIFDDVQFMWQDIFTSAGLDYRDARMRIFSGSIATACGTVPAEAGPFYCPGDDTVAFDPDFFEQLAARFGAEGDFAIAYVIAHELAHHVQNVLGVSDDVRTRQQSLGTVERNALTIRLELQADCLAGVWAFTAAQRPPTLNGVDYHLHLEPGDLQEGLRAAEAVGDDTIQESTGQAINTDNWSHGSAEQREAWMRIGLETGDPAVCNDTFDESVPATEILPTT